MPLYHESDPILFSTPLIMYLIRFTRKAYYYHILLLYGFPFFRITSFIHPPIHSAIVLPQAIFRCIVTCALLPSIVVMRLDLLCFF